jgi:hypothetical protein
MGSGLRLGGLKTLLLSHNTIGNIPADLFTGGKYAALEQLDLSNNDLAGDMPSGSPGAALRVLKVDSNPSLHPAVLPSYFTPSVVNRSPGVGSNGGEYSCRTIEGPGGLSVVLSPSFYNYRCCECTGILRIAADVSTVPDRRGLQRDDLGLAE